MINSNNIIFRYGHIHDPILFEARSRGGNTPTILQFVSLVDLIDC